MDYIKVGQIVSTFGIRGELKLYPLTSNVERFNDNNIFYLGENYEEVNIAKSRVEKNLVILKFKEYNDINEVLKFKGAYLYVSEKDLYELDVDEYYIHDLIGMRVFYKGSEIGKLTDVIENPCNDIYEVKLDNNKAIYVPAVKNFILSVSVKDKCIELDKLDGIIDEV